MAVTEIISAARSKGINDAKRHGANMNPHAPGSAEWYSYDRGFNEAMEALNSINLMAEEA